MKRRLVIMLIIVIAAGIGLLLYNSEQSDSNGTTRMTNAEQTNQPIQNKDKTPTLAAAVASDEQDEEYNPYEDEVFKAQVAQVADLYAQSAKYPIGSQPIRNAADAREPERFEETEVNTPFDTDSAGTVQVSAATDKFQYFSGDIINIRLQLEGALSDVFVRARATIATPQSDTPLTTELQALDGSQTLFTGSIDTKIAPAGTFATEMLVKLRIEIEQDELFTTVAFRYSDAAAQITGLGLVQPNGPNLDIPLEFNVFKNGYYFVSGVLYDSVTNQPLLALQKEGRMAQGNGQLTLQAHIQALRVFNSEGPYVLRNIKAYRGAEQGEQFDSPVSGLASQFAISAFPFSAYENSTYEDPLAAERAEFLRNLGGVQENTE